VTHTATDQAGLKSSCTNTVRVVDTTPPKFDAGSLAARYAAFLLITPRPDLADGPFLLLLRYYEIAGVRNRVISPSRQMAHRWCQDGKRMVRWPR